VFEVKNEKVVEMSQSFFNQGGFRGSLSVIRFCYKVFVHNYWLFS